MRDDIGQARIVCPDCGTEQTVPIDEWEAIVDRHNEQRHGGAVAADLEEAILPNRELKTDGGSEMVDVVSRGGGGSQRNSIHTDPECHRLQFASNSTKKPREDVNDDRICSFCSGEHEAHQPGHNPNKTRQKLLDMDPEDLGLSPMADRGDEEVADAE